MAFADNPDWRTELAKQVKNGELVVPAGEYFMMGDNRDNSNDGRYWGFVPRENIIGTPVLIYMSIEAPEDVWEPGHVGERFATYLNAVIHPGEIRWKRLFHIFCWLRGLAADCGLTNHCGCCKRELQRL